LYIEENILAKNLNYQNIIDKLLSIIKKIKKKLNNFNLIYLTQIWKILYNFKKFIKDATLGVKSVIYKTI
jgi:hypothetical protein